MDTLCSCTFADLLHLWCFEASICTAASLYSLNSFVSTAAGQLENLDLKSCLKRWNWPFIFLLGPWPPMEADTVSYYKLQCHGAVTVQADIYRTLVLQDKGLDFLETCNQTHTSTKRLSLILRTQHNTSFQNAVDITEGEKGFETVSPTKHCIQRAHAQPNPHDKFKAVRTCYITTKLVQLSQPKAQNSAASLSWEQIIYDKCMHTHTERWHC